MTRGPSEDARVYHQPRVLNRHGDAEPGPAARERHAERARQQVLRQRSPRLGLEAHAAVIPRLAHESEFIGRVTEKRMKLRSMIIRSPI